MKKLLLIVCATLVLPLSGIGGEFRELKDGIGIIAKICNPSDVLIDAHGWKLTATDFCKKGYRPIRMYIENKSDKAIIVSGNSMEFPITGSEHIVKQVGYRPGVRTLAWLSVANGILIPLTIFKVLIELSKSNLVRLKYKDFRFGLYSKLNRNPKTASIDSRCSISVKIRDWYLINKTINAPLSNILVAYPQMVGILVGCLLGVNGIAPLMYHNWLIQNRELAAKLSSDFLCDQNVTVEPGTLIQKIVLLPQDTQGPVPFSIFHAHDQSVLTKFQINCT